MSKKFCYLSLLGVLSLFSCEAFGSSQGMSYYHPVQNYQPQRTSSYYQPHAPQGNRMIADNTNPDSSSLNGANGATKAKESSTPSGDAASAAGAASTKADNGSDKADASGNNSSDQDNGKGGDEKAADGDGQEESDHGFSGTLTFVSDYRFRGISQTMRRPAVQGSFEYSYKPIGAYVGIFGSNVDGTCDFFNNTSLEFDFYGGFRGDFSKWFCSLKDFSYDVGVYVYTYPGGKTFQPRSSSYNTVELFASLTYKVFNIKFWIMPTNYYGISSEAPAFNWRKNAEVRPNGSSKGSNYVEFNFNYTIWEKKQLKCWEIGKMTFQAHVGHQVVHHYSMLNYTDWLFQLNQDFDWFTVFVSLIGTNAEKSFYKVPDHAYDPSWRSLGCNAFVFGVTKAF